MCLSSQKNKRLESIAMNLSKWRFHIFCSQLPPSKLPLTMKSPVWTIRPPWKRSNLRGKLRKPLNQIHISQKGGLPKATISQSIAFSVRNAQQKSLKKKRYPEKRRLSDVTSVVSSFTLVAEPIQPKQIIANPSSRYRILKGQLGPTNVGPLWEIPKKKTI